MQCPKCNFENPPEAKFCGKCGEPMNSPPPFPPGPPDPKPGVSKEMKIGIAIGSVFIPLLGIIMGAIYMNDANPEKKKVGKLWLFLALGVIACECLCFFGSMVFQSMNRSGY